jgi:DNA invertase Pin-like site-specific DNA recombinase
MCVKVGYIRVSTTDQNPARQETIMRELGAEEVFIDQASGKNAERPQLKKMLEFVRKGDTVVIESISRLARNTKDLLTLVEKLKEKGVGLVSHKESFDTNTPSGKFMLTMFGALAELEREYLLQRQAEGIVIAKQNGKYKGGKKIENENFPNVYALWKNGEITAARAMNRLGMKRNTFYRRVKEYEMQKSC